MSSGGGFLSEDAGAVIDDVNKILQLVLGAAAVGTLLTELVMRTMLGKSVVRILLNVPDDKDHRRVRQRLAKRPAERAIVRQVASTCTHVAPNSQGAQNLMDDIAAAATNPGSRSQHESVAPASIHDSTTATATAIATATAAATAAAAAPATGTSNRGRTNPPASSQPPPHPSRKAPNPDRGAAGRRPR